MQETVYEHVSGGETFTITAAERWSVAMIRRLKEKYPDQVEIAYENKDGSLLARVPFDWMRIVPKRRDTMTDEQRAAFVERMKGQHHREKSGQIRTVGAWEGNYTTTRESPSEWLWRALAGVTPGLLPLQSYPAVPQFLPGCTAPSPRS